jgi:hypothetical protein
MKQTNLGLSDRRTPQQQNQLGLSGRKTNAGSQLQEDTN